MPTGGKAREKKRGDTAVVQPRAGGLEGEIRQEKKRGYAQQLYVISPRTFMELLSKYSARRKHRVVVLPQVDEFQPRTKFVGGKTACPSCLCQNRMDVRCMVDAASLRLWCVIHLENDGRDRGVDEKCARDEHRHVPPLHHRQLPRLRHAVARDAAVHAAHAPAAGLRQARPGHAAPVFVSVMPGEETQPTARQTKPKPKHGGTRCKAVRV